MKIQCNMEKQVQDRSKRQFTRYQIEKEKPAFLEKRLTAELFIHISNRTIPANMDDISVSGCGFTIDDIDEAYINTLEGQDDFFVEIQLDDNRVVSYVRKIWTLRKKTGKGIILRGGASFDILSAEDRNIIQAFVDKLHVIHGNL